MIIGKDGGQDKRRKDESPARTVTGPLTALSLMLIFSSEFQGSAGMFTKLSLRPTNCHTKISMIKGCDYVGTRQLARST